MIRKLDNVVKKVKSRKEVTNEYMRQCDKEHIIKREVKMEAALEMIRFDREEKIPDNWEIAEKENQRIIDHYSKMEGDSSSISDNSQRRPFVDYEAAIFTDFVKPIDTETKAFDSKKVYRLSIYLKLCSYYIRRLSKIVEIYNIDSSVIEELQEALIYAYTIATSEELYNPQNYIQTLISKIAQLIEQPIERQNPNSQAALLFLMAMRLAQKIIRKNHQKNLELMICYHKEGKSQLMSQNQILMHLLIN